MYIKRTCDTLLSLRFRFRFFVTKILESVKKSFVALWRVSVNTHGDAILFFVIVRCTVQAECLNNVYVAMLYNNKCHHLYSSPSPFCLRLLKLKRETFLGWLRFFFFFLIKSSRNCVLSTFFSTLLFHPYGVCRRESQQRPRVLYQPWRTWIYHSK